MSYRKISQIKDHEQFRELDALFVVKPENVLYILGFRVESEIFMVIPREGKISAFLPSLEIDRARELISQDVELSELVEPVLNPPGNSKFIYKTIRNMKLNTVGFEDEHVSVNRYKKWQESFRIPELMGANRILSEARLIKTPEELERMKKAGELGDIGFKAIIAVIEEGMTEKELAAEAEYAMRKAGSEGTSFPIIIASGELSAFPHTTTSEKKIEDGDLIIVDIGAIYKGYCSDMTRTFIYGKVSKDKANLVNLVNEGQHFALDRIKADAKCAEIDKEVREFFINRNKEWGSRFIHGLGHGVGIDIHEDPYLNPLSPDELKEGMVVTVEPGLYIPGLGGARTEDMILVKKEGFTSFTNSKKTDY